MSLEKKRTTTTNWFFPAPMSLFRIIKVFLFNLYTTLSYRAANIQKKLAKLYVTIEALTERNQREKNYELKKMTRRTISSKPFKRVCYLRPEANFPIDAVMEQNLCTHLILAFVGINADSSVSYDDNMIDFMKQCRQSIQNHGSDIKLMFSIGGGGVGGWKQASSTPENRARFVRSIMDLIQLHDLDGVDIDWEFPGWGRNFRHLHERNDFIELLHDIREAFDRFETTKPLVLSAAVAGQISVIRVAYKVTEMAKYLDFINLMTYDYHVHKWYNPFAGHNSPMNAASRLMFPYNTFSVKWAANYWNRLGFDKDRIMVGIPTYGKRYTLYSKHWHHPGAWALRGGDDCSYSEVCDFLHREGTLESYDQQADVPYAHNGQEWISYENERSASRKTEWIVENGFGGAMLFSLNADDFKFRCDHGKIFPIHAAVRDISMR